jgi:2-polyprenyl-3-methyl-5-hydroxy-6-metoxy-1,4-benzoquinol methylase
MTTYSCRACAHQQNHNIFQVKEMQLGFREDFNYMLCDQCGCMQIIDIPEDLAKYYPNSNYYSFSAGLKVSRSKLRQLRSAYLLHGKNKVAGKLLTLGYKHPEYLEWMKNTGVDFNDRILDVGAGSGQLLKDLCKIGFTNLEGIDPFIDEDVDNEFFRIRKKDIFSVEEKYDLLMLHHVFEHMDEPREVLDHLYKILNPGKYLLIRTPVMGMYGWKKYGLNWVGLDAPRHIIIHSLKSMKMLAEQSGFEIRKIVFDSVAFHFWSSEQYQNDIALMEPNSYMVDHKAISYSKKDIEQFKKLANKTNKEGMGDQAAYYLFKP